MSYRIAVLRGGPSEEHEVSLRSGASVLSALSQSDFEPLDIIINRAGEWIHDGRIHAPETIFGHVDMAFLALHGAYGEDGRVQRLLERHAIPYTGSDSFSSAIAMHKGITKDYLRDKGVHMAPHMMVSRSSLDDLQSIAQIIEKLFGPAYIIKPMRSGSSVGITTVDSPMDLARALRKSLEEYDEVLVEKRISGREGTFGVVERLRDEKLYELPPVEIIHDTESPFFNYEAKYNGKSNEVCPGRFSKKVNDEMARVAALVHRELGLSQYSRSDFMIDEDDDVYFLEVNTLPGLTEQSLLPKMLDAVSISFPQFIEHIVHDTLRK